MSQMLRTTLRLDLDKPASANAVALLRQLHAERGLSYSALIVPAVNAYYHDAMFAAGYTDVERGERGSTEEHLTTVQFKVMKEQEALDAIMAQQQSAEQAVHLAQANREEAEHEVEAAKRKIDALAKSDKEVKAFVQSLGSAGELLPDTGMLETARSYRENKALPVIKKLVRKLREVYALLVNARQKNNDMHRETAYWKRKAEPNELMIVSY